MILKTYVFSLHKQLLQSNFNNYLHELLHSFGYRQKQRKWRALFFTFAYLKVNWSPFLGSLKVLQSMAKLDKQTFQIFCECEKFQILHKLNTFLHINRHFQLVSYNNTFQCFLLSLVHHDYYLRNICGKVNHATLIELKINTWVLLNPIIWNSLSEESSPLH